MRVRLYVDCTKDDDDDVLDKGNNKNGGGIVQSVDIVESLPVVESEPIVESVPIVEGVPIVESVDADDNHVDQNNVDASGTDDTEIKKLSSDAADIETKENELETSADDVHNPETKDQEQKPCADTGVDIDEETKKVQDQNPCVVDDVELDPKDNKPDLNLETAAVPDTEQTSVHDGTMVDDQGPDVANGKLASKVITDNANINEKPQEADDKVSSSLSKEEPVTDHKDAEPGKTPDVRIDTDKNGGQVDLSKSDSDIKKLSEEADRKSDAAHNASPNSDSGLSVDGRPDKDNRDQALSQAVSGQIPTVTVSGDQEPIVKHAGESNTDLSEKSFSEEGLVKGSKQNDKNQVDKTKTSSEGDENSTPVSESSRNKSKPGKQSHKVAVVKTNSLERPKSPGDRQKMKDGNTAKKPDDDRIHGTKVHVHGLRFGIPTHQYCPTK